MGKTSPSDFRATTSGSAAVEVGGVLTLHSIWLQHNAEREVTIVGSEHSSIIYIGQ
jgi:hypothetical protein